MATKYTKGPRGARQSAIWNYLLQSATPMTSVDLADAGVVDVAHSAVDALSKMRTAGWVTPTHRKYYSQAPSLAYVANARPMAPCFKRALEYPLWEDTPEPAAPDTATPPDSFDLAELVALHTQIAELQAWKRDAIHRFPVLDIDPLLLKAREFVAKRYTASLTVQEILSGRRDKWEVIQAVYEHMKELAA